MANRNKPYALCGWIIRRSHCIYKNCTSISIFYYFKSQFLLVISFWFIQYNVPTSYYVAAVYLFFCLFCFFHTLYIIKLIPFWSFCFCRWIMFACCYSQVGFTQRKICKVIMSRAESETLAKEEETKSNALWLGKLDWYRGLAAVANLLGGDSRLLLLLLVLSLLRLLCALFAC